MDSNHGADELDLDEQTTNFELPLAIVPANQQGTRRHGTSCTWTPVSNANHITAQPFVASQQQTPENRIPGPAGNPATIPNGSGKKNAYGGGAGGWSPAEFLSSEWQAGLRLLNLTEFQEHHPLLQGNTVHAATSLKESGIIPRLLLYIVSIQHAHNGESYVKFRDPSGTIGGTFVEDVLSMHPNRNNITRGAVVILEKVAVLKTPPPHSLHHLCIVSENVVSVIPRERSGQSVKLPVFSSAPDDGEGGGRKNVDANAGQQVPPARLIDHLQLQQTSSQFKSKHDSLEVARPPPQQQQQEQLLEAPPQQQPSYVEPQVDTADDLLDGLDDEFTF